MDESRTSSRDDFASSDHTGVSVCMCGAKCPEESPGEVVNDNEGGTGPGHWRRPGDRGCAIKSLALVSMRGASARTRLLLGPNGQLFVAGTTITLARRVPAQCASCTL